MRVRRLILPALGPERALCNAATIHALTEDAIDSWPLGLPFKLQEAMQSLGLHGTFYTVSGWVGQPSYLTLANLQQIAADGNEIARHTIEHPDLPTSTRTSRCVRSATTGST